MGGVLGVPLDGGEPAPGGGEFEPLHSAVGGVRGDRESVARAVHPLVVVALLRDRAVGELAQPAPPPPTRTAGFSRASRPSP
ncbi:hypothetical protein M2164_007372 [Streptomyces sp. SAI-208]|nr:hypothetical protein [Streptomyces sp. SAI-041]MDH6611737.1 hypothetical protein [Streptomyces sp. SAI-208]